MSLAQLTAEEREVVRRVLEAAIVRLLECGGEMEYEVRMGLTSAEAREFLAPFPNIDDAPRTLARQLIHQSFNEILNGLQIDDAQWQESIGVSRREVRRIWDLWIGDGGPGRR